MCCLYEKYTYSRNSFHLGYLSLSSAETASADRKREKGAGCVWGKGGGGLLREGC